MRPLRSSLPILAACVLAFACAQEPVVPLSAAASIAGRVTDVRRSGERNGSIRVEAQPADSSESPKAVVQVEPQTLILDAGSRRTGFDGLRSGQWVRAWFTGPERRSYPVQATAAIVVIDSAAR